MRAGFIFGALLVGVSISIAACGSGGKGSGFDPNADDSGAGGDGGFGEGGVLGGGDGGANGDGGVIVGDPVNCADAKTSKSYVGCDYWPTVTANGVWSIFDFAVVVSNVGASPASITVTGGDLGADGGVATVNATVAPGALEKIYLPWVPSLKGVDLNECGSAVSAPGSVLQTGGAYHLVSSSPVVVYQFNALEYGPNGGPPGKNWSACPGTATACASNNNMPVGCLSYTNDASLLLPSTAMTENYRVMGIPGVGSASTGTNTFFAVTAVADNTNVTATISSKGAVLKSADNAIAATAALGSLKFTLAHAGDVAEVMGTPGGSIDLSGSLVQADQPIQVISGTNFLSLPVGFTTDFMLNYSGDHTEQSMLPAETLGKHYVVPMPDNPAGGDGKGVVRLYGNEDGTTLTYNPSAPAGCPATLSAGEVVQCNATITTANAFDPYLGGIVTTSSATIGTAAFEVTGDKEFGVALFQPSSAVYGSSVKESDPSETVIASVEQYRLKYLFLAPTDYDKSFADIVGISSAAPVLDGKAVTATFEPIGSGPYGLWRIALDGGPKSDGAHTLTSTSPVGLQVVGYGNATSYQYPGGLNLNQIAPAPPPPR